MTTTNKYFLTTSNTSTFYRLDSEPTEQELAVFATAGFSLATFSRPYSCEVSCKVNGDSYIVTRQDILNGCGQVVGHVTVD